MTPTASLRVLLSLADDTNMTPSCSLDTDTQPAGPLQLSGFQIASVSTVVVPPAAADQAFTFTNAVALVLQSDEPFSLRLAAGETLVGPVREFVVWGSDIGDGALSTGILLTGNGSNEALIKAVVVEQA